jgi:hypothetical protein
MTVKQRVGCGAMSKPAGLLWTLLASCAVFLSLVAGSSAVEVVSDPAPEPPRLTYLTETATSKPKVWVAAANGSDRMLLGQGQQPLLSPDGLSVAVSLFGVMVGDQEQGPSLGIYPSSGAPIADYLNLETAFATPLAWSPDSRYLAVYAQSNQLVGIAAASSLDVIDTQTGTLTTIAHGAIYGASFAHDGSDKLVFAMAHSLSGSAATNLYISEASGAGMHSITSDGRSLFPVWGPTYIAYDRERSRHLSPEYQIWMATSAGVRVRKLTHIAVGPLVQGLVPLAFSGSGSRLLAEFEGEDTSNAYAVSVASGRAHSVNVHGQTVQAGGISSDGSTLLVDVGSFEQPSSHGRIETVPFAGGPAKVLVAHGSQASWND